MKFIIPPRVALCLLMAICAYAVDKPEKLPGEILTARTIGVYFDKDDEMARRWLQRFLVQPPIATRFTYLPDYEEADIVLVLDRQDIHHYSRVGIPDTASTITMPDGSVTGVDCIPGSDGRVDCWVYEGSEHVVDEWHWSLSVYRGRDFGKNLAPPGMPPLELPPSPGIVQRPVLNLSAKPLLRISESQEIKPCVEGRSILGTDLDGIVTGCEVVEFWDQLQRAENKPELATIPNVFNRWKQAAANPGIDKR